MLSIDHNYQKAELGMPCRRHLERHECSLLEAGAVDILWGSGPCQPFSRMRQSGTKDTQEHPGYSATFGKDGSLVSLAERLRPAAFLAERVLGFAVSSSKAAPHSTPKDDFVDRVMSICGSDGKALFGCHACIKLDSKDFVDGSRPRRPGLESSAESFFLDLHICFQSLLLVFEDTP